MAILDDLTPCCHLAGYGIITVLYCTVLNVLHQAHLNLTYSNPQESVIPSILLLLPFPFSNPFKASSSSRLSSPSYLHTRQYPPHAIELVQGPGPPLLPSPFSSSLYPIRNPQKKHPASTPPLSWIHSSTSPTDPCNYPTLPTTLLLLPCACTRHFNFNIISPVGPSELPYRLTVPAYAAPSNSSSRRLDTMPLDRPAKLMVAT
jgi:hypothetical protein